MRKLYGENTDMVTINKNDFWIIVLEGFEALFRNAPHVAVECLDIIGQPNTCLESWQREQVADEIARCLDKNVAARKTAYYKRCQKFVNENKIKEKAKKKPAAVAKR